MADGLSGSYMVFNADGEPLGVLDMDSQVLMEAPVSLEDEEYLSYMVEECGFAATTVYSYKQCELRVERVTNKPISRLTVEDMRSVMRNPTWHPRTRNLTLSAVKSKLKWLILEKRVEVTPELHAILQMRGNRRHYEAKEALSAEEAVKFIAACRRPNDFRLVYLGLFAGTRISEAARIREEHWLEDRLKFPSSKTRKTRQIPIHPELQKVREVILSKSPPSPDSLKHNMASLAHWTNVAASSHVFRRTFGVTLSEVGVDRDVIGALLGHTPSRMTTLAYVPVRWEEMTEAMKKLRYPMEHLQRNVLRSSKGLEVIDVSGGIPL